MPPASSEAAEMAGEARAAGSASGEKREGGEQGKGLSAFHHCRISPFSAQNSAGPPAARKRGRPGFSFPGG